MSDLSEHIEAATLELRQHAESLMLDTCMVTRPTADYTDPITGEITPGSPTVLYTGKARRQSYQSYEQAPNVAEHTFTVQRYQAHFPVGAFEPQPNDVVTWTACPNDPDRVGTKERIVGGFAKTYATAMRLFVEEG